MAQLIVAAAGAAIGGALAPAGFAVLGMSGAQLGWMAGSLAGSMLNKPPAQHGPRLDDSALRVTGTEYGQCIPWIVGAPRVPGIIVWASDRRETSTTEEVGKGGGQEYTTYTYDCDVMYLVADRPGCVVTRIWMNGKLAWTSLASSDDASRLASDGTEKWRRVTVYDGSDTQLPDPTYDAVVGNAPAYRGRTTVFIEGLQLGKSGALPNFTFEVASDGGESDQIVRRYSVNDIGAANRYRNGLFNSGLGVPLIRRLKPSIAVESYAPNPAAGTRRGATLEGVFGPWPDGYSPATLGNWNGWELNLYEATTFSHPVAMIDGQPVRVQRFWHQGATTGGTGPTILSIGSTSAGITTGGTDLTAVIPAGKYIGAVFPSSTGQHLLICTADSNAGGAGELLTRWYLVSRASGVTTLVRQGTINTGSGDLLSLGTSVYGHGSFTSHGSGSLEDDLTHVWYAYGAGDLFVRMYTIGADDVLRFGSWLNSGNAMTGSYVAFSATSCWAEDGYCVVVAGGSYTAYRRAGSEIRPVTLRTVVQDLCARAGMPAGTYDASALASITTPVRALAIPQVSSARATLDMLMTSHRFVAALSDKLYWLPRSVTVEADIAWDDLGAGDERAEDDPLEITIGSDLELPAKVAVQYLNMASDQQTGTEYSDRVLDSGQASVQTIQMVLGLLPAEAKGVADAVSADSQAALVSAPVSTTLKYAALWPGSVVRVTAWNGTVYRMRVQRREDRGAALRFELVADDPQALESQQITDGSYTVVQTVQALDGTTLEVLDIPILRDDDDALGYYVAARSQANGRWPGAVVQSSRDTVNFRTVATVSEQAIIGRTTSVLPNWTGGAVMDEVSSVTVTVGAGELSSVTRDQLLADRQVNAMLVGHEIIRFCTASLQSANPNVYKLTRLLRGQQGTEWAMASHASNERAVLLSARGMRRVTSDRAELANLQKVRAATIGMVASDATPANFTLAGIGLKPFAPTNLRLTTDAIGTVSVTWERRTRRTTVIRDGVGVQHPLGEAAEAYEVDVYDATDAKIRTIQTSQPSASLGQATVVGTYARGLRGAFEHGGYLYGISNTVLVKADPATKTIIKQSDPAGTWAVNGAAGYTGGIGMIWVAHDGAGKAYVALDYETGSGVPPVTLAQRIVKFDLATMTADAVLDIYAATSRDVSRSGGVCSGGKLYVAHIGGTAPELRISRINCATMAHEAIQYFGDGNSPLVVDGAGDLVIVGMDGFDVVVIDGATLTEISRTSVPNLIAYSAVVIGDKMICNGGNIYTLDLDTMTLVNTVATNAATNPIVVFGSLAAVQLDTPVFSGITPKVLVIDPATGLLASVVEIGSRYLAGARATTLLAERSGFPHSECDELSPTPDLAGGRAVVYQMSATVGRGYPAEIDL